MRASTEGGKRHVSLSSCLHYSCNMRKEDEVNIVWEFGSVVLIAFAANNCIQSKIYVKQHQLLMWVYTIHRDSQEEMKYD